MKKRGRSKQERMEEERYLQQFTILVYAFLFHFLSFNEDITFLSNFPEFGRIHILIMRMVKICTYYQSQWHFTI